MKISFNKKLIFLIFSLIIVIVLLLTLFFSSFYLNDLYRNLKKNSLLFAEIFSTSIVEDYETYYNSGFIFFSRRIEEIISRLPDISNLILYSNTGEILFVLDEIKTNNKLQSSEKQLIKNNAYPYNIVEVVITENKEKNLFVLSYPILDSWGIRLFTVQYYITYSLIKNRINRLILYIFLFLFFFLIIAYFLSVLFTKSITKSIKQLLFASNQIKHGDYSYKINYSTKDEIGILINNFNEMAGQINHSFYLIEDIFQSIPSSLIFLNTEFKIEKVNRYTEYMFKIKAPEIIQKSIWDIHPFFSYYKNILENVVATKEKIEFNYIKSFDHKNFLNILFYPLMQDNFVYGILIRLDDVTRQYENEEKLRRIQKMETIGNIAAGLAHDFNNILGGISGSVSLIDLTVNSDARLNKKELGENLEIIKLSTKRAENIVSQLLSISRSHDFKLTPIDLNSVIKNVYTICKNSFDKSIKIEIEYWKSKAIIKGDMNRLEQVILNLAVNAAHAMTIMRDEYGKKGGTLQIKVSKISGSKGEPAVPEETTVKDYYVVSVQDNGVGMSNETIAKIYDPFFTTKKKGQGTGLGMSMVYNIIQDHNGLINIYSEITKGTNINVYIPASEETADKNLPLPKNRTMKGNGVLLFCDDEEIIREMGKKLLQTLGYNVLLAESGPEAIKIYESHFSEIKGVILDTVMPEMDGYETFSRIKEINRNVKVIISSGFSKDRRVQMALNSGAIGFLPKPYSLDQLSKKLEILS